ncbi:hypothetical protein GH714_004351 [Hevea brasiliensis]|uniref:EF-hand domain-containing protein n=1 Tax=Hevea brasiliensis TaxID=3981 RepID=A0A6A6KGS5_HEVBR|nr:hypothetical protein GH714_004351 [Hevea brasiliensis]
MVSNRKILPTTINFLSPTTQKRKQATLYSDQITVLFCSSRHPFIESPWGRSSAYFRFSRAGKQWRHREIRLITDRVFNRIKNQSGRADLSFEDLYITVLLVYNDINKHLPGPHFDPPSKDQVRALIQECDLNLDGEIDYDEFVTFIRRLTTDTFAVVSQGLILTLVVAPTVAMATKKATEGVPGVGKVVQKYPILYTHPSSLSQLSGSKILARTLIRASILCIQISSTCLLVVCIMFMQ